MNKMFKKLNKKNGVELRSELSRAHLIISLLASSLMVILCLGIFKSISFDPLLSGVCIVLLLIVVVISLSTCCYLTKSNRK